VIYTATIFLVQCKDDTILRKNYFPVFCATAKTDGRDAIAEDCHDVLECRDSNNRLLSIPNSPRTSRASWGMDPTDETSASHPRMEQKGEGSQKPIPKTIQYPSFRRQAIQIFRAIYYVTDTNKNSISSVTNVLMVERERYWPLARIGRQGNWCEGNRQIHMISTRRAMRVATSEATVK
jgi:hypothetical protein